uniref:MazG nucleotide pyrophosphohydrolase domain-containing protein n=1 Tax=Ningiella ruwaisensis TaxID=2364274 RepID=UPI00109F19B0|nr:MazG nucleotide pyrophosphohydrolase domain-containing protein [Ningiella ruwaisensis]
MKPENTNANSNLALANDIQIKAKQLGFDWPDISPVFDKVREELDEVRRALKTGDKNAQIDEVGDLLFAVVNLARHLNISPDDALKQACQKFDKRFTQVKQMAQQANIDMSNAHIDELEALWQAAKKR